MGKQQASFSVLFWNVWVDNQTTDDKLQTLCGRLSDIIKTRRPDVLGLNEVITSTAGSHPKLLQHLESLGYHTHFTPFSRERNGDFSGSALASITKPLRITVHELGPDKYSERRGHPGNKVKLIHARVAAQGQPVNIVVNHLAHLVPYNWASHLRHHRAFRAIAARPNLRKATIIGGDFNQFKFMPTFLGAQQKYHWATGSFWHPTWKLLGKIPIIQANYDNIFWTKCGTFTLEQFEVLHRAPSDHAPLFARFRLQPEAAE